MPNNRSFSWKHVIVTALISFAISGGGGYYLYEWQNRAKPGIVINSIGFVGSSELLEVGKPLIKKTQECAWLRSYKEYEWYDSLDSDYKKLVRVEDALKKGLETVEIWLSHHRHWAIEGATATINDLLDMPICKNQAVMSSVIGSIRREEHGSPPNSLSTVRKMPEITDLTYIDTGWVVDMKAFGLSVPVKRHASRGEKKGLELLARSVSNGDLKNLHFYMNEFLRLTSRELNGVQEVKVLLESKLLPASHIGMDVSFHNSGNSPIIFKPYMAIDFDNTELKGDPLILKIEREHASEPKTDESSNGKKKGTQIIVDSFLPRSVGSQYSFIPPNSTKTIRLASLAPLGAERGERILALFRANALKCCLVSVSGEGEIINSNMVVFGESISKGDKMIIDTATGN